ncbi:hypothetical protein PAAL109150_10625 [Paenibacillus alkaliterrae]
MKERELFVFDGFSGADPINRLVPLLYTEKGWTPNV